MKKMVTNKCICVPGMREQGHARTGYFLYNIDRVFNHSFTFSDLYPIFKKT